MLIDSTSRTKSSCWAGVKLVATRSDTYPLESDHWWRASTVSGVATPPLPTVLEGRGIKAEVPTHAAAADNASALLQTTPEPTGLKLSIVAIFVSPVPSHTI